MAAETMHADGDESSVCCYTAAMIHCHGERTAATCALVTGLDAAPDS